jgi:hypothetical protein
VEIFTTSSVFHRLERKAAARQADRKLMSFWAKCQKLKVSKSDICLFCVLPGSAILVTPDATRGTDFRSLLHNQTPRHGHGASHQPVNHRVAWWALVGSRFSRSRRDFSLEPARHSEQSIASSVCPLRGSIPVHTHLWPIHLVPAESFN